MTVLPFNNNSCAAIMYFGGKIHRTVKMNGTSVSNGTRLSLIGISQRSFGNFLDSLGKWKTPQASKTLKNVVNFVKPAVHVNKRVNIIRQRLKDIELQRWLSEINNDTRKDANQRNKMRTYRLFKTIDNYKCEDYLHQVTNTRHRIALTKLRLSNHKLAIETGRYSRPFKKPAELSNL